MAIHFKGSKGHSSGTATQSRKESVAAARGLMVLSKRKLAEAKKLREQADKLDPAERDERMKKVMEILHRSRELAEEAQRLATE